MKMREEHYAYLQKAIAPLDTEELRSYYRNAGLSDKRYRWDLHYRAGLAKWTCDELYPYLNDDHIDTALRKICALAQQIRHEEKAVAVIDRYKELRIGQVIEHKTLKNADGTPLRARVNGKMKVWKTRPHEFQLPMKHGLKN